MKRTKHESRQSNSMTWTTVAWLLTGALFVSASWAADMRGWSHRQELKVPAAGIVKVSVPPEALDVARPRMEDVRMVGPDGKEVPFLIDRPEAASEMVRKPKSWQVTVEEGSTRVLVTQEGRERVVALMIESPAPTFVKAVTVRSLVSGGAFETLASRVPIFRQSGGVSQLRVAIPDSPIEKFELVLHDDRSGPIPISGVSLVVRGASPPVYPVVTPRLTERTEAPGETRMVLDLGAANLMVGTVRFGTSEGFFSRRVTLLSRQWQEGEVREQALASGNIYRLALEGESVASQLAISVDRLVSTREVVVLIENGDSPPLSISEINLDRQPVYLVFLASSGGVHQIFLGNYKVVAPRYDIASLATKVKDLEARELAWSRLESNPDHHSEEVLPAIPWLGASLDTKDWTYRRLIHMEAPGVQQLELDPSVLSRAQPHLADIRLMREGRQVPYILERTSLRRTLTLEVVAIDDPKRPRHSRWSMKLPERSLPIAGVVCDSSTPLFQREMRLYEMLRDDRGERYPRELGFASWQRTPGHPRRQLSIQLAAPPQSDELMMETDNGDNPPIVLEKARGTYPVARVLFNVPEMSSLSFHYGNPRAVAPSYDLSLVADQLLRAPRRAARLGDPDRTERRGWLGAEGAGGVGTFVFWLVLTVVVVGLILIVARVLPKSANSQAGNHSS